MLDPNDYLNIGVFVILIVLAIIYILLRFMPIRRKGDD